MRLTNCCSGSQHSLVASFILVSVILVLYLQTECQAAPKIKKYLYLLAGQRHRTYAIPVPFPMPVIVKKQPIYTHVPVIPRYVQQPPLYGSPTAAASVEPYETIESPSSGEKELSSAASKKLNSSPYSSSMPASASTRYLTSVATALGSTYPSLGGNLQRDILMKLVSGQARIVSPTNLITSLRRPPQVISSQQAKYLEAPKTSASAGNSTSKAYALAGLATELLEQTKPSEIQKVVYRLRPREMSQESASDSSAVYRVAPSQSLAAAQRLATLANYASAAQRSPLIQAGDIAHLINPQHFGGSGDEAQDVQEMSASDNNAEYEQGADSLSEQQQRHDQLLMAAMLQRAKQQQLLELRRLVAERHLRLMALNGLADDSDSLAN